MKMDKILVVLPHPDDEVFPMSGTLSKQIAEGSQVTYMCMTLGQMGRNLGNPPFANRISLPEVREKELRASCKIIGIQDLRLMGLHDKTIEFEPYDFIDSKVLEVIKEIKPDVIFTFHPKYGVHPDHNACGAAVIRTVGNMKPEERPLVLCTAFPTDNDLGKPEVVNDISDYMEQKLGALGAHSSQFRIPELQKNWGEDKETFMKRIQKERFWTYKF